MSSEINRQRYSIASRSLLSKVPLVVLVGLFLLQFFLIWFYAVDIPYWDEWTVLYPSHLPKGLTLQWLFEQQNEHRPLTTKFLVWLLYRLTGWNLVVHQLVNFALFGFILSWIIWFAKKVSQIPLWLIAGFMIFLLSPNDYENHFWGYQSLVHLWLLFFLVSTYYLFKEPQEWSDLIIGCVLSVLSLYSFGSGVVSSSVVLLLFSLFKCIRAFSTPSREKRIREFLQAVVVLVIVGSAIARWLIGYSKPPYHPPLTFPNKWKFWDFFLNNVAFGFGIDRVSALLGAVCVLIVLVPIFGILIKKKDLTNGQWTTFAIVIGALAVFGSIALSRAGFGPSYAKSSRYAEFGMILIPLALLSWSWFLKDRERLRNSIIAVIWIFCFLTFGNNWVGPGGYGDPVTFGTYRAVAKSKLAGVECVKNYYLHGGDAACQTLSPTALAAELEQARKLNVSFYRTIAQQYRLISVSPKRVSSTRVTTIGVYRPSESIFFLRNTNLSGEPDLIVPFGLKGDIPIAGDWDGNGTTTVGVYRPSESIFYLRNTNSSGEPDLTFGFGLKGDIPIAGDWDGNGTTTVGVYRPSESMFYLRNTNSSGEPDLIFGFGLQGDIPIVGDWDGNGTVTIGVYRPALSLFFLRNANSSGEPDLTIGFGLHEDIPIAGDWDGNGTATIGVYRPSQALFFLRNTNSSGEPDLTIGLGMRGDIPIVGDWDGK